MALVSFIDIRFGDPVLCLSMSEQGIAYGSAFGRILYHNFWTGQEIVIAEFSEECIRGIHVARDNIIYSAVGDLYNLVTLMSSNQCTARLAVSNDNDHSVHICHDTQVLMREDVVCLITIPKESLSFINKNTIHITQISSETKRHFEISTLPPFSSPIDFDGNRVLFLSFNSNQTRTLNIIEFKNEKAKLSEITKFKNSFGHISHMKLVNDLIILVQENRHIKILDISTGKIRHDIGSCKADIAALNYLYIKETQDEFHSGPSYDQINIEENLVFSKLVIVTVDVEGSICIWDNEGLIERNYIRDIDELTDEYKNFAYFSMGYPYVVHVRSPHIAFSTDIGIFVIKSAYFDRSKAD
ncbi:unnamed protein product [Blepharisma stoltei]|uniref:Uncharacterized protein n=1 Tax=Blepharisma stoltei TaxID=1481888 RepID=A0AAU9J6G0_9CILI|nr:unnamed protein product [Blepharisma stoltei]